MAERSGRFTALARLVPAATFLLGLLIGSLLVAVGGNGGDRSGDSPGASPGASPSASPSASTDVRVTVPAACGEAAANLKEATQLLRSSVGSVKDFDPQRIVDQLNRLEELDAETRPLVRLCSQVQVASSGPSATPSS